MDKVERGALMVEKEELEQSTATTRSQIDRIGQALVSFGSQLRNTPDRVVFSNAPSPLGSIPLELMNAPSFEFRSLTRAADVAAVAQLIQDLRAGTDRLRHVEDALRRG